MPIVNDLSKISTDKMVLSALKELAERRGSSLHAIKKYIAANYNVDMEKRIYHVKKYLRSALEKQVLKSTSNGLNGRFTFNKKTKKEKQAVAVTKAAPLLSKLHKIPTSTPIVDAKKKKMPRKSLKKVLALKTSSATKRLSAGGKPRPRKSVLTVLQDTPKTAIFVKTPATIEEEAEKPTTSKKAMAAAKAKKTSKKQQKLS